MTEERVHKALNILETYFSDANLNFDKLLKKYISEDTHGCMYMYRESHFIIIFLIRSIATQKKKDNHTKN